ncbi:helix-turn-helix transcriptional regulator [Mycobacterium sp. E1747]|uniref:helix-turn-helix transcriptional regulator n=1 Tax=Mycobacterium sp. E1747 TaxID=1834128 RepID=UPI0009EE17F0|nr:helix-turn-helix transcriptional regulator [Mycobacterium sp. E1747]
MGDRPATSSGLDRSSGWRLRHCCPQEAADEARRAHSLAARCGGAQTPALRRLGDQVGLTSAEHEAARLATSGRSNKEIAENLCVSVRSVEGRLQRVCTKLGISKRSQLVVGVDP